MAFVKSENTEKFYLSDPFNFRSNIPQAEASRIADVLGFAAAKASGTAIKEEMARVAENRAGLVKEIADAVLAGISAGVTVTAEVDPQAIALAVEAQLSDELGAIPGAVVDELKGRLS